MLKVSFSLDTLRFSTMLVLFHQTERHRRPVVASTRAGSFSLKIADFVAPTMTCSLFCQSSPIGHSIAAATFKEEN